MLIGDKGYLSSSLQSDLLHATNIRLETPMRKNYKIIKSNSGCLEKQEKEWRHFSLNFVRNL